MGKSQRIKGRAFEQLIATAYRERWPEAVVRRSLQAHQPYESDVVVEHPDLPRVAAMWTECQHAAKPAPLIKLAQAERDADKAKSVGCYPSTPVMGGRHPWLPVVVWRKSGAAQVNATMRHWVWATLAGIVHEPAGLDRVVITLDFRDFMSAVRGT